MTLNVVGRLVDADDLVTASQIAARCGSAPTTVLTWRRRYSDMPAPVAWVNQTRPSPVWLWSEIEVWLVKQGVIPAGTTTARPAESNMLSGRQVADLLGWSSSGTAWQLHRFGTFPAPTRTEPPRLWSRAVVAEWAATHPRRPNRRMHKGTLPDR